MSDEKQNPEPKINLLQELPQEIKKVLPTDYDTIEYIFHLDGVSIEKLHSDLQNKSNKKTIAALLKALQNKRESGFSEAIQEELNYLYAQLKDIGTEGYVDSFKTEKKLFQIAQERYKLAELTSKDQAVLVLVFCIFEFEFYQIADCEIFWKLTDSETPDLVKIMDLSTKVLDSTVHSLPFAELRRAVIEKLRGKIVSEELLRFLLSANKRVERLVDSDSYQILFSELTVALYPYRILYEKGDEMDWKVINDEIVKRLKGSGKKLPQTSLQTTLSANPSLYKKGSRTGWFALKEWNIERKTVEDILEEWFRDTKTPAGYEDMVAYVQSIRSELKNDSIYSSISSEPKIIEVQQIGEKSTKKFYYHKVVALPDGWQIVKKKASATSTRGKKASTGKTPVVFISYAHEDAKLRDEFKKFLNPMTDTLVVWDDTQIRTGNEWNKEIEKALAETSIALLLVSQDFVASEYIMKYELPYLLKKKKQIHWVYVDACDVPLELQKIQAASMKSLGDMTKKRNEEVLRICTAIGEAAKKL